MHQETQPTTHEKEPSKLPRFDEIATELLEDKTIQQLPSHEQGQVIADRFIGSLVRHGSVEGSQVSYDPIDTLLLMDKLSAPEDMQKITGTDGLRGAVRMLAYDERVAPVFGNLANRIGFDNDKSQYTFTSLSQLEGYLASGKRENYVSNPVGGVHMHGDDWMPVVLEHAQRMSQDTHIDWMSMGKARELMESSAPLIKNTGRDWQAATLSAERIGVDMDLVRRSAETIQRRVRANHELGATALLSVTRRRVDDYKQSLDRRSGF